MTEYVYYIRRDGNIKIGYSAHLAARMRVLRPDSLLAVEPGNLLIEAGRHHQFEQYHLDTSDGREWFAPGPELLDHIALMASIYPMPDLDELLSPPRSTADDDGAGALGRLREVDMDDLRATPTDELLALLRDAVIVRAHARGWTGQFVRQARDAGVPWSKLEEETGVPKATLDRRSEWKRKP